MNRREFLIGLGAAGAGACLPAVASPARECKVIGIGAAGCNLATALRASNILDRAGAVVSYVCVDLGPDSLHFVEVANEANPARPPIKTLMLAPLRAGGNVNAARAACLRHRVILAEMLAGSDMVVLLAGLGGGTGSGISPIMARLARATGAVTVAAVVTPFDFEGAARNRRADAVINRLQHEADLVMTFSNEEWINRFSGDDSFLAIWDALDRHVAESVWAIVEPSNKSDDVAGTTHGCLRRRPNAH